MSVRSVPRLSLAALTASWDIAVQSNNGAENRVDRNVIVGLLKDGGYRCSQLAAAVDLKIVRVGQLAPDHRAVRSGLEVADVHVDAQVLSSCIPKCKAILPYSQKKVVPSFKIHAVLVKIGEDWALARALVKTRVNPGLLESTNGGLLRRRECFDERPICCSALHLRHWGVNPA